VIDPVSMPPVKIENIITKFLLLLIIYHNYGSKAFKNNDSAAVQYHPKFDQALLISSLCA
jgi:hypothetical protein